MGELMKGERHGQVCCNHLAALERATACFPSLFQMARCRVGWSGLMAASTTEISTKAKGVLSVLLFPFSASLILFGAHTILTISLLHREGHGTMELANGEQYIGEWKNDNMHGKGRFVSSEGEYEGLWVQGLREGQVETGNHSLPGCASRVY